MYSDEQIAQELANLSPELDGDERTEHPDTQYSDYPEARTLKIPKTLSVAEGTYWIGRARELLGDDLEVEFVNGFER